MYPEYWDSVRAQEYNRVAVDVYKCQIIQSVWVNARKMRQFHFHVSSFFLRFNTYIFFIRNSVCLCDYELQ